MCQADMANALESTLTNNHLKRLRRPDPSHVLIGLRHSDLGRAATVRLETTRRAEARDNLASIKQAVRCVRNREVLSRAFTTLPWTARKTNTSSSCRTTTTLCSEGLTLSFRSLTEFREIAATLDRNSNLGKPKSTASRSSSKITKMETTRSTATCNCKSTWSERRTETQSCALLTLTR